MTDAARLDEAQVARILQASDWFVRVSEEQLSEQELARWLQWCKDPDNLREFQRVRATSEGFDRSREAGERLLQALALETGSPVVNRAARNRHAWRVWAAALVCVAAGLLWLWQAQWRGVAPPVQFASADVIRTAVLPDGTTVTLAPRSRLSYVFDTRGRQISLAQGEAYFNVHHDRSKPFVVAAGALSVTAVGTAFDVRLEPGRVVTLVQEGSVMLDLAGAGAAAGSPARLQLGAGYLASFDPLQRSASVTAIDADRELGWRDGRLRFLDRTLNQVVDAVNRYAGKHVALGDARLGELRFTGTVFIESVDDWVAALSASFALRVTRPDEHDIVLLPTAGN